MVADPLQTVTIASNITRRIQESGDFESSCWAHLGSWLESEENRGYMIHYHTLTAKKTYDPNAAPPVTSQKKQKHNVMNFFHHQTKPNHVISPISSASQASNLSISQRAEVFQCLVLLQLHGLNSWPVTSVQCRWHEPYVRKLTPEN